MPKKYKFLVRSTKYFIQLKLEFSLRSWLYCLKMKNILYVVVLAIVTINCQEIDEIFEASIIPFAAPAGFSESGHYGTRFATRKSYFRSNTRVKYKYALK